ncbi:protocadherin gamma-a5 [Lynx pardinus]|uniref:Protocadherin gamma-a5 n=1 Tax=Lynx pardinus TaxID=191816 RepID=A0A485MKR1_LYNPA|nr:protocadherin gamma-a5 [Lynx pardinus]
MADTLRGWGCIEPLLLLLLLETLWRAGAGTIRYSVLEELDKGSFVGSIAKDLGLEPRELAERGVRIVSRGRTRLFSLNPRSGSLVTAGRIDREELCAQSARCVVSFNILLENNMKIYGVEIEIIDINDNFPRFRDEEVKVKVNENAATGTRLALPFARDADVSMNSLQSYKLSPNMHFSLEQKSGTDGQKYPELVLERPLDREKVAVHDLLLTALDGGDPILSSSMHIHVVVLDANDNAPLFTQSEYRVTVPENIPVGSRLLTLTATDPDEGVNGELTYSFRNEEDKISETFQLDSSLGEISTLQSLDYEESRFYLMEVVAQDGGALLASAKVLVTVQDVNDNVPEVILTSLASSVSEDCPPGTVIALFSVHDGDSGENGEIVCSIPRNLPFKLEKSVDNYYHLLTTKALDREEISDYNITITVIDSGNPPLSTESHISLNVADINDNPPVFPHTSYSTYILENNPRGISILSVTAHDPDSGNNAKITYSLAEDMFQGMSLSTYVFINSNTGILYALGSFDYEQVKDLQLWVMASDSGDPPLSSNMSLSLFVLDQNDNAPEILYPSIPTDGSTGVELAPRSAEPGYLVTKVVAVDRDSGQNAWLSYHLLKVSEPGLFTVGLHTGEVRTARALLDRDALKQSLVVVVQDHGQPPLSATVTLTVAVADSIPDVLADLDSLKPSSYADDSSLTLYLVVAVAIVSCVFLTFVIVLLALRLRRWHSSSQLQASGSRLAGMPTSHFVGVDGVRAFLQTYSHEVSLTADSRNSHMIFPQPNYADTLISQESCGKSEPPLISEKINVNEELGVVQPSYVVHVVENNPPGASIAQVSASDPDLGPNGHVSYSIVASDLEPRALASYVSVSAQSGVVFAQRAFDHEQLRAFELTVQARDQGSPALSANVSLRVLVGDRNDNAPRVLYPALGPDGSALFDTVPRAAQPGYLVTKVVAVDADSGHNAWLSYHVLQASEPGLFSLGLRTGEVRTARALGDRDAARQRLLVAVRDGGQPPLSATVTLLLVFADSLQEALPDVSDRPEPSDPQAELQFYLVVALALISVLFLLAVILAVALSLRRSSRPSSWSCFKTDVCSKTGSGVIPNFSEGTLPYSYNLCAASHSSETEFKFLSIKPENGPSQDLLCNEASWFESANNDNRKMTSNSVNLQQVSYVKTFYFYKYN